MAAAAAVLSGGSGSSDMAVYILRGPSGCGKSTWARAFVKKNPGALVVSRDIIRQAFGMQGKGVLPQGDERLVTKIELDMLRRGIREGRHVVVDNTNLDDRRASVYATEAHLMGVDFMQVNRYESGADWLYVERSDIPTDAVLRQCKSAKKMHPLQARVERIVQVENNSDLPDAYIFDVDGTLADSKGIRSPYDYSKVYRDRPIMAVSNVAAAIDALNVQSPSMPQVIFVSGRKAECRDATENWLWEQLGFMPLLFMRADGDDRHDAQVKYDILRNDILPRFHVLGVFDDRARVVQMWQSAGIRTMDCGQGVSDF